MKMHHVQPANAQLSVSRAACVLELCSDAWPCCGSATQILGEHAWHGMHASLQLHRFQSLCSCSAKHHRAQHPAPWVPRCRAWPPALLALRVDPPWPCLPHVCITRAPAVRTQYVYVSCPAYAADVPQENHGCTALRIDLDLTLCAPSSSLNTILQ